MMLRSATDRDRDEVVALGVEEEVAWFGQPDVTAEEVGAWIDEEGGLASGVVALDGSGRIRGFASPGRRAGIFLADPAGTDTLADALLPWLRQQRDVVSLMTFAGDTARVSAFERHGMRHRRSSVFMVRHETAGRLPAPAPPPGVDVAPYRLGEADEAVHRLIYVDAAWGAVAGHAERDFDAWLDTLRPAPTMFLARRDGRPVGWVAGRLLESGRGYITTLAVATGERGRGLGRALLLHAFTALESAGAQGLALDVQAENDSALGLYRSVGLEIEREWRLYATAPCTNEAEVAK